MITRLKEIIFYGQDEKILVQLGPHLPIPPAISKRTQNVTTNSTHINTLSPEDNQPTQSAVTPQNKNNNEGHWNKLKRAVHFILTTWNKSPIEYSAQEEKEYRENKFYIKLIREISEDLLFVTLGAFFSIFVCTLAILICDK